MKFLAALKSNLSYHREAYLFVPVALLLLTLGILFVGWLTGRDVTEDLGSLVACLVTLVRISLIALFVGALQKHFFGYRSERTDPVFRDDVFDAIVTVFLFLGLGYVVFCK